MICPYYKAQAFDSLIPSLFKELDAILSDRVNKCSFLKSIHLALFLLKFLKARFTHFLPVQLLFKEMSLILMFTI